MTTDKDRPETTSNNSGFLAAEREIARLYRERNSLPAATTTEEEERTRQPYYAQIDALEDSIALSAPPSLVSAAVKLRRLLDPDVGMEGETSNKRTSLEQILALIESEIAETEPPYRSLPRDMSRLEVMIEVENRIRTMAWR